MESEPHIFFVDDELKAHGAVRNTLERNGSKVSCFVNATDCLERLRTQKCDLLIADVKMPDTDAVGLLTAVKRIFPWLPVLAVTGHGNVSGAVKALKAGAFDLIEKPLDRQNLLLTVKSVLKRSAPTDSLRGETLTKTETEVLRLVLDGRTNGEIAHLLHRSVRTIEVHRSHIMHKLGVRNIVGLVKRAFVMGLIELPGKE